MRSRAALGAVAVVLGVGAVLGIAALRDGDAVPGAGDDDPGVVHVHGLGVDPSDGSLIAATHFGVFRIPDSGQATRIGGRYQDTMGFTVVGPRHFLASGHPDLHDEELEPPEGKPPLLGLIESVDGARTWVPLSLLGEADFHALVSAHGRIYGYDSANARFMVSADGRSWETRSQGKLLLAIAVDPDDADAIVATGHPSGVYASSDGGRTFDRIDGAPALLWLSWDSTSGLWGVAPEGTIFHSTDGGRRWSGRGQVDGQAVALLADGKNLYVAVDGGRIFRSDDGGRSWRTAYRPRAG